MPNSSATDDLARRRPASSTAMKGQPPSELVTPRISGTSSEVPMRSENSADHCQLAGMRPHQQAPAPERGPRPPVSE
eukprot:6352558-Heterocapsa_arctica.AAC.1